MPQVEDADAPVLASPDEDTLKDAEHFATEAAAWQAGGDPDHFRQFRLVHGVYGIRGREDEFMVRVKLPYGQVTRRQWSALAQCASACADGRAHLTTRQCIQYHHVPLSRVPEVLQRLGGVGLTTREACGNAVRNVTGCPLAGVCPLEVTDVRHVARGVVRHLLRHPAAQDLPRKFKIAFSGCARDCALARIHDLGFVAVTDHDGRPGFRVWAAGGLGAAPHPAVPLASFVPPEQVQALAEAAVRVFSRLGNRRNRNRARLKFVADQLGAAGLRAEVAAEGLRLGYALPALADFSAPRLQLPALPAAREVPGQDPRPGFEAWRQTSTVRQAQSGFAAVFVAPSGGNLAAAQMETLAILSGRFGDGRLRLALTQDVVVPWVREQDLPDVHASLDRVGLGAPGALRAANVTGCPGAATCNLALTASNALARELRRVLLERPEYGLADDLEDLRIKVSGCPNSCGHHVVAGIGLQGGATRVGDREVPMYRILLGGDATGEQAHMAVPITQVPAANVPEAVLRIIDLYRANRQPEESFGRWVRRRLNTEVIGAAART